MARRKDHDPDELRQLLFTEARKIISAKGLDKLTARALATAVGYAPGTIYNLYRDMDALVTAVNLDTLEQLAQHCQAAVKATPAGLARLKALAYAYIDFAGRHKHAWRTLFAGERDGASQHRLPARYRDLLEALFDLIEQSLKECHLRSPADPAQAARLLWTCLHGITALTLDGRLKLVGIDQPHLMVDDLLERYCGGDA